jgi:hypothetical protein
VRLLSAGFPKVAAVLLKGRNDGLSYLVLDGDARLHRPGEGRSAPLFRQAPGARGELVGHLWAGRDGPVDLRGDARLRPLSDRGPGVGHPG